ncbi:hypothetical protein EJ06DRAFT_11780 [Trichodelitschia bisporula]|uniref:Uncharacterized protein n=1 Tax=Trichodelitschia bisporula TaxID=703511 RepID=A0A6G1IAS2_9PEZI|nr:hypothetical protein EJ06DRAFT_11780 [Trichodelitschia bisporula]
MWLLSILSGVLLAFPVALTVGVYLGIESQHIFHGGFPNTGGYGPNAPQTTTYCQKSYGITPDPGRYVRESLRGAILPFPDFPSDVHFFSSPIDLLSFIFLFVSFSITDPESTTRVLRPPPPDIEVPCFDGFMQGPASQITKPSAASGD